MTHWLKSGQKVQTHANVYAGPLPNSNSDDLNDEPEVRGVQVQVRIGEEFISPLFVIVEMYDHKGHGKGKREYEKKFSEKERRIIASYQTLLRRWYLQSGIPRNGVAMKLENLELLRKAANFFASL